MGKDPVVVTQCAAGMRTKPQILPSKSTFNKGHSPCTLSLSPWGAMVTSLPDRGGEARVRGSRTLKTYLAPTPPAIRNFQSICRQERKGWRVTGACRQWEARATVPRTPREDSDQTLGQGAGVQFREGAAPPSQCARTKSQPCHLPCANQAYAPLTPAGGSPKDRQ